MAYKVPAKQEPQRGRLADSAVACREQSSARRDTCRNDKSGIRVRCYGQLGNSSQSSLPLDLESSNRHCNTEQEGRLKCEDMQAPNPGGLMACTAEVEAVDLDVGQ
jgi:hypothetical protein